MGRRGHKYRNCRGMAVNMLVQKLCREEEVGFVDSRSIVNKKNELNIMVEAIDPHIIGITESWANIDITDAELGLTGYVMFRKDRTGRRGGGVILYVKESIQAYEIKLEREADCDEAVWCKIVSGNSKLTIGLVYRSPNINEEDNTKIKNAIKEVSKGECIIMGDFNHGHIQWNSLESTGIEDKQFLCLIQDSFLIQHVLEPTRGENVLDIVLSVDISFSLSLSLSFSLSPPLSLSLSLSLSVSPSLSPCLIPLFLSPPLPIASSPPSQVSV